MVCVAKANHPTFPNLGDNWLQNPTIDTKASNKEQRSHGMGPGFSLLSYPAPEGSMAEITNPEFQSQRLNPDGIAKIEEIKRLFDALLNCLTKSSFKLPSSREDHRLFAYHLVPPGRYLSIVKTKLEEACMFAEKAVASDPINQEQK